MEELFKAFSDKNRLRLFWVLLHGEYCVCELEVFLRMNQSTVSFHLQRLRSEEILKASKSAQWVHYTVDPKFTLENQRLVEFMQEKLALDGECIEDLKRVERYVSQGLNCKIIADDRERVVDALRG